jgi:hypothetical protein
MNVGYVQYNKQTLVCMEQHNVESLYTFQKDSKILGGSKGIATAISPG